MVLPFGDLHHHNLEPLMSFNNILHKIWSLPRHSHTGIVHSVARLESISKCALISDLFSECAQSAYTALGYNNLFGGKHLKCYTVDDELCAAFIRDARDNNRDARDNNLFDARDNNLFGGKHLKCYTVDDELCAAFIRDARSDPHLNKHLDNDIYCISTV